MPCALYAQSLCGIHNYPIQTDVWLRTWWPSVWMMPIMIVEQVPEDFMILVFHPQRESLIVLWLSSDVHLFVGFCKLRVFKHYDIPSKSYFVKSHGTFADYRKSCISGSFVLKLWWHLLMVYGIMVAWFVRTKREGLIMSRLISWLHHWVGKDCS